MIEKHRVGAGLWQRAALGLAVVAWPACAPVIAGSQVPKPIAMLAAGSRKTHGAPASPPVRATEQPALSIPIEPLGFSPPGAFYLGLRTSLMSLDFLDEDHLLLTFRVPGLIRRDPTLDDARDERQVRAVVLRLPQGTVQAETMWTLHDRLRYLWMLGDGHFLLRDKDSLQLGDESLELKPFLHFPGPLLWVELDPGHKLLVTGSSEPPATASKGGDTPPPNTAQATITSDDKSFIGEPGLVLRILRRDTGKVMLVSHIRSAVHLPINSEGYLESLRGRGMAWVLNFNYFSGGSRILGNVDSVCSPMLDFVAPGAFLATTCDKAGDQRLVAMTTAGHRLWDLPSPESSVWPVLVTSRDGLRLARETLIVNHSVNAAAPLGTEDIKGQDVQVFDLATGKVVLRAQASPVFDAGGNVAISPSARHVAIIMNQGLELFDLPAPPPLPEDVLKVPTP